MTHPGPHQPGSGDPYGASGPGNWGQAYPPHAGYPMAGGYQGPPPPPPVPGYPPYGQPYGGSPYVVHQRTNGMAVASMVLGILWIYWIGSILALVFGYTAKRQIQARGDLGGGMATAGIVLGWIGVGLLVLPLFFRIMLGF